MPAYACACEPDPNLLMSYDTGMLDGWNKTLDILLIFSGLFSAVATAFVIESYQLLTPDTNAYMAFALYALVVASNNSAAIAALPVPPVPTSSADGVSRWINGLWFTSLMLSLGVALLCILVKQWLGEYNARTGASAKSLRHWATRHQYFFQALDTWSIAGFMSILPLLLHIALFLFFAGTGALLWSLDRAIGVWISALGVTLVLFYTTSTIIPMWKPDCPTSTPLIHHLHRVYHTLCNRLSRIRHGSDAYGATSSHRLSGAQEGQVAQDDILVCRALHWLSTVVADSDATAVATQAIGSLVPDSPVAQLVRKTPSINSLLDQRSIARTASSHHPADVLRDMRSILCVKGPRFRELYYWVIRDPNLQSFLKGSPYPELNIIGSALTSDWAAVRCKGDSGDISEFPTLSSTALLLLRISTLPPEGILPLLSCSDISHFSNSDWNHIFTRLRGHLPDTPCSRIAIHSEQRRQPSLTCDRLCHIETLAHWFDRNWTDQKLVSRLLIRCLVVLENHSQGASVWGQTLLRDMPYFLRFLSSRVFLQQPIHSDCLRSLIAFILNADRWNALSLHESRLAVRALKHVLEMANLCGYTLQLSSNVPALIGVIRFLFIDSSDADRQSEELHPERLAGKVPLTLLFARPVDSLGSLGSSAWQLTCAALKGGRVREEDFSSFACAIAHMICAHERTPERQAMISDFLAQVDCRRLLEPLALASSLNTTISLIQHCVEWDMEWWNTGVRDFLHDRLNERMIAIVANLNEELLLCGPCARSDCAAVGGWSTETIGVLESCGNPRLL